MQVVLTEEAFEDMSFPDFVRSLLLPTAKTVGPAVVVAIVGHQWITRLQHHYWRLQKTVELQDEAYREARRVLVAMVHALDMTLFGLAALAKTTEGDRAAIDAPDPSGEEATAVMKNLIENRMALAELSNDIDRLFSNGAFAAFGDAAASINRYYEVLSTASVLAAEGDSRIDLDPVYSARGDAVLRVRNLLRFLAKEIGKRRPGRVAQLIRRPPRFGRRSGDLPDQFLDITRGLQPAPNVQKRRCTDRAVGVLGDRRPTGGAATKRPGS